MLRRTIAAGMLIALAILLLPCATPAQAQKTSHECCAPTASASSPDCCNTASPQPATTSASNPDTPLACLAVVSTMHHPVESPLLAFRISAVTHPPARIPITILRT